jgi:hypothetical protein
MQARRVDPFFQSLPWEVHRDERGVIAEVFLLPANVRDEGIYKGERYEKILRNRSIDKNRFCGNV